jgi:hypothetical protein
VLEWCHLRGTEGPTEGNRQVNVWTEIDEDGEEYIVDEEWDDLVDDDLDTPMATNYYAQFAI